MIGLMMSMMNCPEYVIKSNIWVHGNDLIHIILSKTITMITLYVNILAERIVLANSNLLLEKSCHNKKLDSVRSAGLSLENLSSYLPKPLFKNLVLADSVVVGHMTRSTYFCQK